MSAIVKAQEESRFLLCVVYSPSRMPARGADHRTDLVSPEVLEKAAWRFMLNGARVGIDHRPGGEKAAKVVESYVHRGSDWIVTGPDGTTQTIRPGDWCVGMILSKSAWADYKAGRFGGVSMQGRATRRPVTRETLAGIKE